MNILINTSNLGPGGATQVADSICRLLKLEPTVNFTVVLQPEMSNTFDVIKNYSNVKPYLYKLQNNWRSRLCGRVSYLDNLIKTEKIDVVFSVFAPTWWIPRCPHLCGFALAHLIMPDSPYIKMMSFKRRVKFAMENWIMTYFYRRSSKYYYSENINISARVKKLLGCKKVYTITNYYNQVFDDVTKQKEHTIPKFDGVTLLTVSNDYPHKNLRISLGMANFFYENYNDFQVRFVMTIDESSFGEIPEHLKRYFLLIGKVDISECPSLYQQATFEFQPSLLECFTATYPEAMRIGIPIITSDLDFSRGLCGDAAIYYNPLSVEDACEKVLLLSKDEDTQRQLIDNGYKQLHRFDNYEERVHKIVSCCKEVYNLCSVKK